MDLRTIAETPSVAAAEQPTADGILTLWVDPAEAHDALRDLRDKYSMLFDLTAIDECERQHRGAQPPCDFTVVYHLLSLERVAREMRVKVGLSHKDLRLRTVTDLWPNANWYEREVYDMFGIRFDGHPDLRRILMPPWWEGHPLRKEHPARATESGPLRVDDQTLARWEEMLRFDPEVWHAEPADSEHEPTFLNIGPNHPATHGVLRLIVQMKDQEVADAWADIGYHHRGAEKMGERQSWHTYIPYTDRVDYLSGVMNNFPYVMAVETLGRIDVPDRARVIRIMLAELYRISNHLVFYATLAQDIGMMSPAFWMFTDREHALDIVEAVTGARMHANWFRIGGVAQDLPEGWEKMVRNFLEYLPTRLREYDRIIMKSPIARSRLRGIGAISRRQAIDWGATGPMLRATGEAWDLRKQRPYGGYDQFEFDVPSGDRGDCYDRVVVHVEEMRQSLRIIRQCMEHMPSGPYKAQHSLTTPPPKDRTLHDIDSLIGHFLSVSWGPVIPPGEASATVEAPKGLSGYYLISDGGTGSYRTRIRTPSFPHIQMVPMMCRQRTIPDVSAILGSVDYVLADVDR